LDLTKHPILVSAAMPVGLIIRVALEASGQVESAVATELVGIAIAFVFMAQVFVRSNGRLSSPMPGVFVKIGLAAWPLMVFALVSSEIFETERAYMFEALSAGLVFLAVLLLSGFAATALERAEKGLANPVAVAGTMFQLFCQPFCTVRVCHRLNALDAPAVWWK